MAFIVIFVIIIIGRGEKFPTGKWLHTCKEHLPEEPVGEYVCPATPAGVSPCPQPAWAQQGPIA